MAKLNYFFEESVVEIILNIPIPVFQREDCWAWTASNSGLFSVKSAYWLSRVESPPSNIDAVRGQKTKIRERFKMLLWRIAANLLPSKDIISRFNESMDLCCPLFISALETTLHLFTVCPFSKSLWYQSQWGLRMEVLNFESPSKFVNFLLTLNFASNLLPSHREDFLLFGAVLCDVVWKQRNSSIFENMDINLDGVAAKIFSLFVEHKSARAPLVRFQVSASALGWVAPPRLGLKINVDAAVGPRFSVIATVTRDWRGNVVFAGSRKVNTIFPLQTEAEAVRWALSLVLNLRCGSITVETDSQVVANLSSNLATPSPWRIKFLCSDLRNFHSPALLAFSFLSSSLLLEIQVEKIR
nr:uncharacterized protein LOC112015076 [Quercus suber]